MTNAQHLVENAIYGITQGTLVLDTMQEEGNQMMLKETGVTAEEVAEIVDHVVYGLYDGKLPEFPEFGKL